jgi:hypothetical protein
VIGKYAFNRYNTVGLFMVTLHLDCLVLEHLKMNMTFLVINKFQIVCSAIQKHLVNSLDNDSVIIVDSSGHPFMDNASVMESQTSWIIATPSAQSEDTTPMRSLPWTVWYHMTWKGDGSDKGSALTVGNDHGAKSRSSSVQRDHNSSRHLDKDGSDIYVGVIWQSRDLWIRVIFEVGLIQLSWIGFRLWASDWWRNPRSSCIIMLTWLKMKSQIFLLVKRFLFETD